MAGVWQATGLVVRGTCGWRGGLPIIIGRGCVSQTLKAEDLNWSIRNVLLSVGVGETNFGSGPDGYGGAAAR